MFFVQVGWISLFVYYNFILKSKKVFIFSNQDRPSENTIASVRVSYKKSEARLGLNSFVRFYDSNQVYAVGYLNKKRQLGFPLKLVNFKMTSYQGTQKAKTYESEVKIFDKTQVISMNEPLKQNGYTFYQSSYELDEKGNPSISILSVNKDSGRFIKYLGSIWLVLGVILLFLRKKMRRYLSR